jgi:hypothetical protein
MSWWDKNAKKAASRVEAKGETPGQQPAPETGADRSWRSAGVEILPLGKDRCLLLSDDGRTLAVPRLEAELLELCSAFAPLPAHARSIAAELDLGEASIGRVGEMLTRLAGQGFLVPYPAYPTGEAAPREAARIEAVGIRSAERPEAARRCLAGFIENARRHGRDPEWHIYDDSRSGAMRGAYRDLAAGLAAETRARLSYSGLEERRAYVEALAAEGVSESSARFCLLGPGIDAPDYGLNLNAQLLDLVDRPNLGLDEDLVCRFGPMPGSLSGASLGSGDPTEFLFFPDRESALAAIDESDGDFIGLHEALLGRSPGELLAGDTEPAEGERVFGRLALAASRKDARIAVTHTGIGGDSAMGSSRYFLEVDEPSRARLLADERLLDVYLENRSVLRAPIRTTIADCGFSMSYAIGVDARLVLPPFFPLFRNSDGVFGLMLSLLAHGLLYAYLPWTVEHDPPSDRRETRETMLASATGYEFLDLLMDLMAHFVQAIPGREGIERRMRILGRLLSEAGRLDRDDFTDLVRPLFLRRKTARLSEFEDRLARYDREPPSWAERLEACARALEASLEDPLPPAPRELAEGRNREEALAVAAALVGSYGDLLQDWPGMLEASRRLRERGISLSKPIK